MLTDSSALVSVSNSQGLERLIPIFKKLKNIVATSGTCRHLEAIGIKSQESSEITGFAELFGGRVKTLHPKLLGPILANPDLERDRKDLETLQVPTFRLVVVNLYPFEEKLNAKTVSVEDIDIGGVTLLRAAAKNFQHVCVLSSPSQYEEFVERASSDDGVNLEYRRRLAAEALHHTAGYDLQVSAWLNSGALRYGENPHQWASVAGSNGNVTLSYNNKLDLYFGAKLARWLGDLKSAHGLQASAWAMILKHNIPCGVAFAPTLAKALRLARSADELSAYGGVCLMSGKPSPEDLQELKGLFLEVIACPPGETITGYQGRATTTNFPELSPNEWRSCGKNQTLVQATGNLHTTEQPAVDFGQAVAWSLKSNAWAAVREIEPNTFVTLAVGMGEPNRVESLEYSLGARLSRQKLEIQSQDILVSDGFLPFADNVDVAFRLGFRHLVQPGGSKRDQEVEDRCKELGIKLTKTGSRLFLH